MELNLNMSRNFDSISLTCECFVKTTFFLNVQIKCKSNSVFDLISQHNDLFSGYIMYIVWCDCRTVIHFKHQKVLEIAYPCLNFTDFFFHLICFSELFFNYIHWEREREGERGRERVLNQISLTRASMPHQRVLVYHF